MKIACLQFSPVLGDVDNNLTRADAVLAKANVQDLDLLVLPELAFSGKSYLIPHHQNTLSAFCLRFPNRQLSTSLPVHIKEFVCWVKLYFA